MATRTSTQSGNLSAGGTWVGGVAPVDNDIIVIATGHDVVCDISISLGSNSGNVGDAVTINGTDATTFGRFSVNDGVTLTLKGNAVANNRMMINNRYAKFDPQPGCIITGDCASDFQSIIDCRGRMTAIGTALKPITFNVPAANEAWSTQITDETIPSGGNAARWDSQNSIGVFAFAQHYISNSGGTGLGSKGDSSVTFNTQSPGTILDSSNNQQGEVATLGEVTSAGKYFIDYRAGLVYFYTTSAVPNAKVTYKYWTCTKGWGITCSQNNDYCSAVFQYCNFTSMGPNTAADKRVLDLQNRQTATVAANRTTYIKNCTFERCREAIGLKTCSGASGDLIQITDNQFYPVLGDTGVFGSLLTTYRASSTYVNFSRNAGTHRLTVLFGNQTGTVTDNANWTVQNNTFNAMQSFMFGTVNLAKWSDLDCSNNTLTGIGYATDGRLFLGIGGTAGHHALIHDNIIIKPKRTCHYSSFMKFYNNTSYDSFHHGCPGPTVDDCVLQDIWIYNNLFFGEGNAIFGYDNSPAFELGYNQQLVLLNFYLFNNTVQGHKNGIVGFNDIQDTPCQTIIVDSYIFNNVGHMVSSTGSTAWRRKAQSANTTGNGVRVISALFDYNLDYNYATRYENLNRQASFLKGGTNYNIQTSGSRNIPGARLFDPNTTSGSSKTLDYVKTSDTVRTMSWNGGTPVSVVLPYGGTSVGRCTGAANQSVGGISGAYSGTLTDTTASFNRTLNQSDCVVGHQLLMLSGVAAGKVYYISTVASTTQLTITCPNGGWDGTIPTGGDGITTGDLYVILASEVTLTDVNGTDTVRCGIRWDQMTGITTAQDTGISFADHSVTGSNPLFSNASGTTAADYKKLVGGAGIDVGTDAGSLAPLTDYFGFTRPTNSSYDMGFDEFQPAAAPGSGSVYANRIRKLRRFIAMQFI